ncbi:MAG: aspartyl protease family protein [Prevotella sp.]|nr:aspartyl protease family protein [Prevotella sp.]
MQTLNLGGTKATDYTIKLSCDTVVPLLIVNAQIGGKTYRFLFDTGADTVITDRLVEETKPRLLDKVPVADADGNVDSLNIYSLSEITLDGIEFNDIPAIHLKESVIMKCLDLDGIIDCNLLRNSVVHFSSPDKVITIADSPEKIKVELSNPIEMLEISPQKLPIFKISFVDNNQKDDDLVLYFDSGMNELLHLSLRSFYYLRDEGFFVDNIKEGYGSETTTLFGGSQDTVQYKVQIPELEIGNSSIKDVSINTTTFPNSRIGATLLEYGFVTIDFKNGLFYFDPFSDQEQKPEKKKLTASLASSGDKYRIGIIWDKELRTKISPGNHVLAVDGNSLEGLTECEVFMGKGLEEKDSYIFTVKDKNGNIKDILVKRE